MVKCDFLFLISRFRQLKIMSHIPLLSTTYSLIYSIYSLDKFFE